MNPKSQNQGSEGESRRPEPASPADVSALRLYSIHDRRHIAQVGNLARPAEAGASFAEWLQSLPSFLGAGRLRSAVDAIVGAHDAAAPVVFAMGGHVVKVGCGPIVSDLMRRGVVTAIACNGATAIHDVELAMIGATSEDVADTIRDGRFGMVRETADFFSEASSRASAAGGYGAAIGRLIVERKLPYAHLSMLATAADLGAPATVHVAIGTDTVHMPAVADGAMIGAATLLDFRIICGIVARMNAGVWCNVGSAVLLPEVFLKAVSVARNLGANLDDLTTVNLDQIRHYRPAQNVLGRPVAKGRGLDLAGHHEIMLPLLRQAIVEKLSESA